MLNEQTSNSVSTPKYSIIQLLIFLILLVNYVYFMPRWADWSQNSRLNLTLAIVDQGTLKIDDYYENTGDYAYFEGHYYTDKAPGPSLLAVPAYAAIQPVLQSAPAQNLMNRLASSSAFEDTLNEEGTGLQQQKIYTAVVLYWITFVIISIPAALLGVIMFRFLTQMGLGIKWSAAIPLIYGLFTPAFPYSGAFYSHQFAAFLLFASFYIGFSIQQKKLKPGWTILAGFMLGLSLISEYPTFLIAAAIFVYLLLVLPSNKWRSYFVLAGIPPGLVLSIYNMAIFRTPLPVGYNYSVLYTEQHSEGFLSLTYPKLSTIWELTFGSYRGLFFISPVLLLSLVGFWYWWRSGKFRREFTVCLWAVVSFMLFNGSSVMWQGGHAVGPRYLVPMLPFLAVGFAGFILKGKTSKGLIAFMGFLSLYSFLAVWAETIGGQRFPDWTPNPLFNYSIPNLMNNDIARNLAMAIGLQGWLSLIPLLIIISALTMMLIFFINRYETREKQIKPNIG